MSFAALSGTSATRCSPGAVSAGTPMVTAIPAISAECPRLLYYPRAPLSRSRARGAPSVAELPDARRLLPREPARQLAGVAPEMPVRGRGVVDGALELEVARDGVRREVERLAHALIELGPRELGRAERLDHHGHGLAHADRVSDLHLAAVGEPGGDDVLRDPARRVRARAIDLGGILAAERAAAVAREAAVRIDDDLAAGESGVGGGAALGERARRIHEHAVMPSLREELRGDDPREEHVVHV